MTGRCPRFFSSSAMAMYGCTSPNEPKVEMTMRLPCFVLFIQRREAPKRAPKARKRVAHGVSRGGTSEKIIKAPEGAKEFQPHKKCSSYSTPCFFRNAANSSLKENFL